MASSLSPSDEPVRLVSLVTTALSTTVSLLLFVGVDPELVAGINLAVAAWVLVIARVVRARVRPWPPPEPRYRAQ